MIVKSQLTDEEKLRVVNKLKSKTIIDPTTGCWLWQGYSEGGYGRIVIDGMKFLTHVWSAWISYNHHPNAAKIVCHKRECSSRKCWNPDHLYIGDQKSNAQDCLAVGNHHLANKTHCNRGHLLDYKFWDSSRGKARRYCSTCRMLRVRAWRERAKIKSVILK